MIKILPLIFILLLQPAYACDFLNLNSGFENCIDTSDTLNTLPRKPKMKEKPEYIPKIPPIKFEIRGKIKMHQSFTKPRIKVKP